MCQNADRLPGTRERHLNRKVRGRIWGSSALGRQSGRKEDLRFLQGRAFNDDINRPGKIQASPAAAARIDHAEIAWQRHGQRQGHGARGPGESRRSSKAADLQDPDLKTGRLPCGDISTSKGTARRGPQADAAMLAQAGCAMSADPWRGWSVGTRDERRVQANASALIEITTGSCRAGVCPRQPRHQAGQGPLLSMRPRQLSAFDWHLG